MQILFEDILVNQFHTTSKDLIKIYTQLYQQGLGQEKILLRFTQFTLIYSYYTQALDYVDLVNQDTSLPEGKTVNEIIDSGNNEPLEQ